MLCLVQHMLIDPCLMTGWVNGNLYQETEEVAGILPIPDELCLRSRMGSFIKSLHSKQPNHFLASMQGTCKPVLPIHNPEERELFQKLMSSSTEFNDPILGPKWELAVHMWNN